MDRDWSQWRIKKRLSLCGMVMDRWLDHTLAPHASECKTLKICAKYIEDCKVETEDWLVHNFGPRKDFGSVNFQINQTAVVVSHHPTEVTKTTSIVDPSLIKPTNMTNCPKQDHQPQHNHGRRDHGLKQINHGNILARDIHKTCGTHQSITIGGG